jgi:hypothetical protein
MITFLALFTPVPSNTTTASTFAFATASPVFNSPLFTAKTSVISKVSFAANPV